MFKGRNEPAEDVGFPEVKTGRVNIFSEDSDLILGRCRGLTNVRRHLEIPCTVVLDLLHRLAGEVLGQVHLLGAFVERIDTHGADHTRRFPDKEEVFGSVEVARARDRKGHHQVR